MTAYEMGKYWLWAALESYRDTPPDAVKRRFIDWLIAGSRRAAGISSLDKRYHNLIVLRYITDTRPSVQRICKALHISRERALYEATTENAVERLLVLAFGTYGLNCANEGAGREPLEG